MIDFTTLADLLVINKDITIRRYQDADFTGLKAIFRQEFFEWFFTNYDNCEQFVIEKLAEYNKQKLIMYVIIDNNTNKIIGTSSLYEISFRHKRLEMGSSWLAEDYHGTKFNALAKLMLIRELIIKLCFNRIQWKTDALNLKSQNAMRKLGFKQEGILERHAITYTSRVRDSVIFAVTDVSLPVVEQQILTRIRDKLNRVEK